jgi:hypothetical protein
VETFTLSGLRAATTYHYELVSESDAGMVRGADRTFTTRADEPVDPSGPAPTAPALTPDPIGGLPPTEAVTGQRPGRPRRLAVAPRRLRAVTRIRWFDPAARVVRLRIDRLGAGRPHRRGALVHQDRVGWNALRWRGRLAGRRLPPGRYRITVHVPGERLGASATLRILPR